MLIDTGFCTDACKDALLRGLKELETDPHSVDVFLTHMHSDHAVLAADIIGEIDQQLLPSFSSKRSNVPSWLVTRLYEEEMPADIVENINRLNPAIAYASPIKNARYTIVRVGELLSVGDYSLKCLWEEKMGIMFTDDHVLFDITPNITTWLFVKDSLGDYLDSLKTILKYPVRLALPGHRKSGNFHERVKQLLQHHQTRLDEVATLDDVTPGSTLYEIADRMAWRIRASYWNEFPNAQKIFAVGECMSYLDYLMFRDRIKCVNDGTVNHFFTNT